MQPPEPARLLRLYDKGNITLMEPHTGLVEAVVAHPVEEIAPLLMVEQLQALRDLAASPPTSPEGCPRTFHMGSWIGPFDWDAHHRERQRLWYDGIWKWHAYFESCPEQGPVAPRLGN
jgi:hypothetical protein